MPRKVKSDARVQSPEIEPACHRTIDGAWKCAVLFWSEQPQRCPERTVSARVMATATAMSLFMQRIDRKGAVHFYTGPGSFAYLDKPYPPGERPSARGLGDLWPPAARSTIRTIGGRP